MGWQAVGLAVTIVIRSYNNADVPAADVAAARGHAEAVLQHAGLNVVWADCWAGRGPSSETDSRCQEPVGGDIVLRLQKAGEADGLKFVSMGFSLVKIAGATPFLSTVYVDRAESVARVAGVDARRVLGLAIAHEIGHILLNSNTHAAAGLMRADWSRKELRRTEGAAWNFLETEAAIMRTAAAARAPQLPLTERTAQLVGH